MSHSRTSAASRLALEGAAVVLGYGGLAFFLLYPLFAHPATTVIDPLEYGPLGWLLLTPDVTLVIWELAWGWHALTTAPWKFFDANNFYPAPSTLAGSEHLLGHLPIFGPIYAVSGNPVLANQLNAWLILALCGAAMYALLRHWGASRPAAVFGGFVYAFCPARAYGTAHVYMTAGQYLPLALLFFDQTLTDQTVKAAAAFAAFLLLQMLCSYYWAFISIIALAGYGLGALVVGWRRFSTRGVLLIVGAGLVAGAVLALISLPYLRLKHLGIIPQYEQGSLFRWLVAASNGFWKNYLVPPIALRAWGYRLDSGLSFYIGVIPLGCALVAALPRRDAVDGAVRWAPAALLGLTLVSCLIARGPQVVIGKWTMSLPYAWFMHVVPGFSSMRAPGRFGLGVMLGIAGLAGLGFDRVLRRCHRGRIRTGLAALVVLGALFVTAADFDLLRFRPTVKTLPVGSNVPQVYQVLARNAPGPVLEIPAGSPAGDLRAMATESEYMFFSTFHWHPLLNGYSGYWPPSYAPVVALARALPNEHATEILTRTTGLRYVVVHLSKLTEAQQSRWIDPPGFELVGTFGQDRLFRVSGTLPADLLPALIDFSPRSRTVLGTPLVRLAESGRRATLTVAAPPAPTASPGQLVEVEVVVTNQSDATWPALASVGAHLVTLASRWEDGAGNVVSGSSGTTRLPYDLAPGESVRASVSTLAPGPGAMRLIIGVAQDGAWFPDPLPPIPITVQP